MLKNFKENEKGNVSLITAIGVVPILLAVAAGIETTNLVNKKSKLQDAVDSAVLAAIHEPNRKEALKVFKEHLGAQGYGDARTRNFKFQISGKDVLVSANARQKQKLEFGAMLGKKFKRIKVQSQAAAERKISRIRFRPTFGSGYLHKDFDLYVNRPNTPTPERLATFTWISSAPVTLSDGSSPGELKTDLGGFIDLDDYSDFFFTVSIMDPWNTYSRAQKVEVYGEDFSLSSNETGVGDHFFVNGKFLDVDE